MLRSPYMMGLLGFWGAILPVAAWGAETLQGKIVAGIVEPVAIGASGIVVDAKIDTGADSCSLDARNIQPFEKDGGKWVRFEVTGRDGRSETLEASLVRTVRIRGDDRNAPRRPVVRLSLCLGSVLRTVDVNLANRHGYSYPALVGRNFLAGRVVVDSGRERLTRPDCPAAPPR
jgi:hypothetical protein